jgi:hypothetical protein
MPEILTESFCERCGTRYTFESAAPRKIRRIGQFKTLSKGLKNYVMSDDTSMDEAMAAARSDQEREATAQQLDAFHSTFNFCMNCRQYTCGNCWNQAEGQCLTCAPLGLGILPAAFPEPSPFEGVHIAADAWPTADLQMLEAAAADEGGNGSHDIAADHVAAGPSNGTLHAPEPTDDADPGATFSFLTELRRAAIAGLDAADASAPVDEPAAVTETPTAEEPEAFVAESAPLETAEPAPMVAEAAELEPAFEDAGAFALSTEEAESFPETVEERASALASRTSELLGRFRPGQNIDDELEAYEAAFDAGAAAPGLPDAPISEVPAALEVSVAPEVVATPAEPQPEPVAAEPQPHPIAAPAWPEPEPIAATAWPEPEPIAAEPEPEPIAAAAAPEPEPVAAVPAEAPAPVVEPVAASAEPAGEDRIVQPTWRIFAPEHPAPASGQRPLSPVAPATTPTVPPHVANAEPQWPAQPGVEESPSMALLANRNRASSDALWAASAQEVLSPPAAGLVPATSGVQPCSNCGLSLSATARFCRRCGTRQG